jgi:DNA-binding transcriptional MerR regulator
MDKFKIINKFQDFKGGADDLIRNATRLSEYLVLGLDAQASESDIDFDNTNADEDSEVEVEGNERLLRHYVSMNVVDRPVRSGRDAIYGFRQLLQYLTARRLLKQGFSLSKIAEFTSVVPTSSLSDALIEAPHRSDAELLVAAFKARETGGSKPPRSPRANTSQAAMRRVASSQPSTIDPIHGMADLLKEIEDLRMRFGREMQEMRRLGDQLQRLNDTIEQSMRMGMRAQDQFMHWVQDIHAERNRCEQFMREVTEVVQLRTERLQVQVAMLSEQLAIHIKQGDKQ